MVERGIPLFPEFIDNDLLALRRYLIFVARTDPVKPTKKLATSASTP